MAKKAVLIIAQDRFSDPELLNTKNVLIERGIEIKIASKTKNPAWGKFGTEISPNLALAEIEIKDFSALVFIGGGGAAQYLTDEAALKLIQDFNKVKKIIGAICLAPSILANAGILISKTVTAYPTEEQNLRDKGADYTGMPVEVDGNIVTARDPLAAIEFGEKLVYLLGE